MRSNDTANAAKSAPAITDEQRQQIREAAQRIAAAAPDHFTAEQRDLIGRTWVRAMRRTADADRPAA